MIKYVYLNLYSDSYYSYTASIEGQAYTLTFTWNSRSQGWYLSIKSEDNTDIVAGIKLVPNFPILFDTNLEQFSGFFYLESKSDIDSTQFEINPRLIYQYFNFYYIYEE